MHRREPSLSFPFVVKALFEHRINLVAYISLTQFESDSGRANGCSKCATNRHSRD